MVAGVGSHQVRAADGVGRLHTVRYCLDSTLQVLPRAGLYLGSHLAMYPAAAQSSLHTYAAGCSKLARRCCGMMNVRLV